MADFGLVGPIAQLLLGGFFAAVGSILGFIVSKHPLLVQIRQAAKGVALFATWLPALGKGASVHGREGVLAECAGALIVETRRYSCQ